jgi:hypothetical protein
VVNLYNQRFSIGLPPQQQSDLVTFLEALWWLAAHISGACGAKRRAGGLLPA